MGFLREMTDVLHVFNGMDIRRLVSGPFDYAFVVKQNGHISVVGRKIRIAVAVTDFRGGGDDVGIELISVLV